MNVKQNETMNEKMNKKEIRKENLTDENEEYLYLYNIMTYIIELWTKQQKKNKSSLTT